jgi:archaeal flagellar protein FlaI
MAQKIIDSYSFETDKVPAHIEVVDESSENVPLYKLSTPQVGGATEALLENLRHVLADWVPLEVEGVIDAPKLESMKKEFFDQTKNVLKKQLPKEKDGKLDMLSGLLLHRMYGLGIIDVLMGDDWLEEVALNGAAQMISVYHRKHGWCKTNIQLKNEEDIVNLSEQIGRKVGRQINSLNPIMDAHLLSGDRVASTLFPISTAGNTITIRRFARNPLTIVHLIQNKTLNHDIAALLWLAIQYELNLLVAGGTASGKTSLLSALTALMPLNQRIISIEDTREISLPSSLHWNWVPLTTRNANSEGKGEVSMLDLMVSSLRMRPDRIVVGEVRRRAQAETMFEAMHTGHSVYSTIHADTVEQVKRRLLEPPIEIPASEVEALHLVLVQFRDRRKGVRRSLELAEVLSGSEGLAVNYLYRWVPRTDTFEKDSPSIRVMEELNLHTGMTPAEVAEDLSEKVKILRWMVDKKIENIEQVGKVMRLYYKQKKELLGIVSRGGKV